MFRFSLIIIMILWMVLPNVQDFKKMRERMVRDQIIHRGIKNENVIEAMRKVPRHRFVPAELVKNSYEDRPLPIGFGQTISQPYIVAYMTDLLKPDADDQVLEVGTGSGYQAAVLAEIVDRVFSVEIIPQLAQRASTVIDELGYSNVAIRHADGYNGWSEHAPYDAIVVTAAAEFIPPPLIEQLKEGGRMVIPVGSPFFTQTLMYIEKKGKKVTTRNLMPVRFVPFTRSR